MFDATQYLPSEVHILSLTFMKYTKQSIVIVEIIKWLCKLFFLYLHESYMKVKDNKTNVLNSFTLNIYFNY